MELNYYGRWLSLKAFYDKISTVANAKDNILIGRLSENWSGSIDTFNPSKRQIGYPDSSSRDQCTIGSKLNHSGDNLEITLLLASTTAIAGYTGTVTYGGTTYYTKAVSWSNIDTSAGANLNLFIQVRAYVGNQSNAFSFRQIGFKGDPNDSVDSKPCVMCYENIQVQTVNAGTAGDATSGLTLKLLIAF